MNIKFIAKNLIAIMDCSDVNDLISTMDCSDVNVAMMPTC